MYSLGWMYANGRGVDRRCFTRRTLFEMAWPGARWRREGARLVGDYTGAVPDCLLPRALDRGFCREG